jgi:hypothetical protein
MDDPAWKGREYLQVRIIVLLVCHYCHFGDGLTHSDTCSFVGPMGETVPPQNHDEAPWIDEVWQSVSVDVAQNSKAPAFEPFFIHEAGAYQRDTDYVGVPLTDIPFYSPSLGKHCDDASGECSFMSWVSYGWVNMLLLVYPG